VIWAEDRENKRKGIHVAQKDLMEKKKKKGRRDAIDLSFTGRQIRGEDIPRRKREEAQPSNVS